MGSDEENDVALLKVDVADKLPVVSLGDSEDLQVGDQVVAIGNPLGELTNTLTVGYVSALDREINTDGTPINMLQTDAAINAGNSGGRCLICTATSSASPPQVRQRYHRGPELRHPINDAMYIVYDLLEYGYVTSRPYMGVSVGDMDSGHCLLLQPACGRLCR